MITKIYILKNKIKFSLIISLVSLNLYSQDSFLKNLDSLYKKSCSNDIECLNECVTLYKKFDSISKYNTDRYVKDVDKKIAIFKEDKKYVSFWKKNKKDYFKLIKALKKAEDRINKIYLPYSDSNYNDITRCDLLLIYKRFIISNLIYLEKFQFEDKYIEIEKNF